ncbi:MAG: AbrB/MazE/SpoVT family DNA-binding domain-containing protein [Oscillospiraceae bacterium]|nr:AbrB/MazE/SpoVT family DNA-binding domain-containing protein [Oscillospiraceae bacterium]
MKVPKGKLAASAKVGEKGQIVIPKEMRDMFSIRPGDTIILLADDKRGIAIPPKSMFNAFIDKVHDLMEGGERDG